MHIWRGMMRRAVRMKGAMTALAAAAVGFLAGAGRVLGDMTPAPVALLTAAGVHGLPVLPMAAGMMAGLLAVGGLPGRAFLSVPAAVAVLAAARGIGWRMGARGGAAVLLAARLCVLPFLPPTPMGAIAFAAESVLAAAIYVSAHGSMLAWKRGCLFSGGGDSICPILVFGLVLGGLPSASSAGIQGAVLAAVSAAVLFSAMAGGAMAASACATALGGLLWILGGIDAETAGTLGICGLVAGCLRSGGRFAVTAGYLLGSCVMGLVQGSPWGTVIPYPSLAAAMVPLWILPGHLWDGRRPGLPGMDGGRENDPGSGEEWAERLDRFALCFREMARALQETAKIPDPNVPAPQGGENAAGGRYLLGEQLEDIGRVVEEMADAAAAGIYPTGDGGRWLGDLLAEQELYPLETRLRRDAMGRPTVSIRMPSCGGRRICRGRLQRVLGRALGCPMHLREDCPCGDGVCTLVYERAHLLTAHSVPGQHSADGRLCGDACASIPLDAHRHMLAISDGMGVGEAAAAESATVLRLLQSLYLAGFAEDVIFRTVNRLLLLRSGEEMYATVDMCILDLAEGSARFIKIGAAPSYILRSGQVTTVHAPTLPIGILEDVRPATVVRGVEAGDIIVMVSDGVSGDGTWVEGILPRLKGLSPEAMAARLLQRARDLGIPGDDRTVLVTRLQADGVHLHAGRAARSWQSRIDPEGSASNAVQFDHNVLR